MSPRALLLAACLTAASPLPVAAQIRASELGSVSQTIDGTKITVEYHRPRVRGREKIWGGLVPWGIVWTPGANWATTLELSRDVKLNGQRVPKGKYSLWIALRESREWTVLLDTMARRFHLPHLDSTAARFHIAARATEGPFTEVLTWGFPDVKSTGGTLAMQWERKRVALEIEVEPSASLTIPQPEAAPYVGRYHYTRKLGARAGDTLTLTVTWEDGALKALFTPTQDFFDRKFALVRVGPDMFAPGLLDERGELVDVLRPERLFTFARAGDRVDGFEFRDARDRLHGVGERRP